MCSVDTALTGTRHHTHRKMREDFKFQLITVRGTVFKVCILRSGTIYFPIELNYSPVSLRWSHPLRCKPNRGPGLALGPLGAPEYEPRRAILGLGCLCRPFLQGLIPT